MGPIAIELDTLDGTLVIGELSLDGSVRHVLGILPMAAVARSQGFKRVFVPSVDAAEAALIPDLEVIPVGSLAALFNHLAGRKPIPAYVRLEVEYAPLFPPTDGRSTRAFCSSTACRSTRAA